MTTEASWAILHVTAASPADSVAHARALMTEYAALPHTVGRWPTMVADLAALPSPFLPPSGALLLAMAGGEPLGCGALRALPEPGCVELKRLYVVPRARGRGVGDGLMRALLVEAARLGFATVRLDTAPELVAAHGLYRRLGFVPIPPYRSGLLADALCFERAVPDGVVGASELVRPAGEVVGPSAILPHPGPHPDSRLHRPPESRT